MDIGIDKLANDVDIILIETWEHDALQIHGLDKLNELSNIDF